MNEWSSGEIYESYVGRWSRLVAAEFLSWLDQPEGLRWLDVGCGTGALSSTILRTAAPAEVVGVDPSAGFVEYARGTIDDDRARFEVRSAADLGDESFDVVVSGLVLNFIPDRQDALRRMHAIGGTVAVYVWDYSDGMELMKYFWDAAAEIKPEDSDQDEGLRFPFCTPAGLEALFTEAGFADVTTRSIVVPTVFESFDAYWKPFLGGQGVAPAYLRSLAESDQDAIRDLLRERLRTASDGSISLTARAYAVRGRAAAAE
ncbi:class I SAM-dependent methyltransferase [Kribbella sancticallisti]|uniref:Class I SAM-dependent methyltransferase n=1 Tax=Kribbella sancticallisti TaxID=460087 RepID=A0ABP4PY14_9ACTN